MATSSKSAPIIEVHNVSRSFKSTKKKEGWKGAIGLLIKPEYQTHEALKTVSFSIEPGSFNGLIGANGAGKTTLLKILSGLIAPTAGSVRVLGFDPFERRLEFRKKIALVMGQKAQLWWDLPALDAFDLLQAIYEIPKAKYQERLNTLAELLDVKKHLSTQIRRLSLGERMKMELIGALIHWPSVIFLDEPTIGLDVLAAHKLRQFLKEFNHREKATIILTSHNMEDIEKLCTRVLILRSGEMVYDGSPQGLTDSDECRLRVRLLQSPTASELIQNLGLSESAIQIGNTPDEEEDAGSDTDHKPIYFTIKYSQVAVVLQNLMKHYQVVNMGIEEQSLHSVIHRLYSDDKAAESAKGPNP